jgi:hypothetical protein
MKDEEAEPLPSSLIPHNSSFEEPPLPAATYRELWLDSEHALGIIAEQLADVLGWQPTTTEPLPDALALADEAAQRIATLERLLNTTRHRSRREPWPEGSRRRVHA